MTGDSISLNKYISQTGVCSRREADKLIEQGRVSINGVVAKKGNRVNPGDDVDVDGERIKSKSKPIYIALNKPIGVTCTTDLEDKDNIIRFIGHQKRIFPIGRLDKSSSGLIFLTNDGDIVNKILREEHNHEKEYIVSVNRPITTEFVKTMRTGVKILGKKTKPCEVRKLGKNVFSITLTQGMNRQIRRMCETLEYKVKTLQRVRIMDIELGKLRLGEWRNLTPHEIRSLKSKL
jgi:23S rRNA pseudouridine2604 synthase